MLRYPRGQARGCCIALATTSFIVRRSASFAAGGLTFGYWTVRYHSTRVRYVSKAGTCGDFGHSCLGRDVDRVGCRKPICAPNLSSADFTTCWLPVCSTKLRYLRLAWDDAVCSRRPSATAISTRLLSTHASSLTDLRILDALHCNWSSVDVHRHDDGKFAVDDLPVLFLPNLVRLEFGGCPFAYAPLMESIRCPASTHVVVDAFIPFLAPSQVGVVEELALKLRKQALILVSLCIG